jgi:hypothetical protein
MPHCVVETDIKMDSFAPVEPDTHVFTGTVKAWHSDYGELITDSGVTIPLVTRGLAPMPVGTRMTLVARKLRPLFLIEKVVQRG